MEECFPDYVWNEPRGPLFRVVLGPGPTLLGKTKKENEVDGQSTLFERGMRIFRPMQWYLQQLKWSPPGVGHRGTSNIELAPDFQAATGTQRTRHAAGGHEEV